LTPPRLRTLALSTFVLGVMGTVTAPLWAQQSNDALRGIQMRLGLQTGIESQSNRTLDPVDARSSTQATVDLSLGVLSETRTQRFTFDLGGQLRHLTGSSDDINSNGLVNPSAAVSYDRSSAKARLSLSAFIRETDLADSTFDLDPETLQLVVFEGTATRRSSAISAQLNWRDDAPLGFGVLARYETNTFRGGDATGVNGSALNDSRRLTLGATVRFDINEATRLNTALTYSGFEEDGVAGTRDTWSLGNDLTIDRPRGPVTFGLDITDTPTGTRIATRVGQSIEYPLGVLSGQVGVSRSSAGDTVLTGQMNLSRALPQGTLSLGLARNVSSSVLEDAEQISTSLSLRYTHELSELSNLSLNADWAKAEQSSTGIDTLNASITATYSRSLTEDWNINVGARHRFRDDSTIGNASSNEVFLNLRREFLTRF